MPTAFTDDLTPNRRVPVIAVYGGVVGGFDFYGPFETVQAALEWHEQSNFVWLKAPCAIALLKKPRYAKETAPGS